VARASGRPAGPQLGLRRDQPEHRLERRVDVAVGQPSEAERISSTLVMLMNLVADVAYAVADPRIRYD
jgi:hypothetical protein